ncbi:MAG: serine/threonine-protein phosphatase [Chloroflexi bacterium]|nr:serine/threonine-protein phosphatase [Chloroflexota bacterium]
MLEIRVAAAKANRYAVQEGGDTIEVIERPRGGISVVMADGQGSGRAAKVISNMVTSKAITMLKEGARDGAAARATHDYLHAFRHGQVSATLNLLSADLSTKSIVVSRNSHCPALVLHEGQIATIDDPSDPIGIHHRTKPAITELEAQRGLCVIVFTDGIMHAGRSYGRQIDLPASILDLVAKDSPDCEGLAKELLKLAIALDQGRPADDMSIVVMAVVESGEEDTIREMSVRIPLD